MSHSSNAEPRSFTPAADSTRALRDAFGTYPTGVTIITAQSADGPVAITANSFSSVSLDPPLIQWAIDHNSNRFDIFNTAQNFAVHVLHEDQQELALDCARDGTKIREVDHTETENSTPILAEYLALFECETYSNVPAGDHTILIGRITKAHQKSGRPLVFANGAFAKL